MRYYKLLCTISKAFVFVYFTESGRLWKIVQGLAARDKTSQKNYVKEPWQRNILIAFNRQENYLETGLSFWISSVVVWKVYLTELFPWNRTSTLRRGNRPKRSYRTDLSLQGPWNLSNETNFVATKIFTSQKTEPTIKQKTFCFSFAFCEEAFTEQYFY